MTKYILTAVAKDDLQSIIDFISQDNPVAASKLLDHIARAFESLLNNPKLGHSRPDLTKLRVRFWPVQSYLIVYCESLGGIVILRVLSGFRDVAALLK